MPADIVDNDPPPTMVDSMDLVEDLPAAPSYSAYAAPSAGFATTGRRLTDGPAGAIAAAIAPPAASVDQMVLTLLKMGVLAIVSIPPGLFGSTQKPDAGSPLKAPVAVAPAAAAVKETVTKAHEDPDKMIKKDYILETFTEFVLSDEWLALNMKSEMRRVTVEKEGGGTTKVWKIKPGSELPQWMDRMSPRSGKTGALQSDTGRQKEALALRGALICYQCGLEQGDPISKFLATTRFFTIDGLKLTETIGRFKAGTTPHKLRKYNGRAADGPVMTTLELAAGHVCIRCVVCAAVKSSKSEEPGF